MTKAYDAAGNAGSSAPVTVSIPPPPPPAIANGGFESGLASWNLNPPGDYRGSGTVSVLSDGNAHSGSAYASFGDGSPIICQDLGVLADGLFYNVSYWLERTNDPGYCSLFPDVFTASCTGAGPQVIEADVLPAGYVQQNLLVQGTGLPSTLCFQSSSDCSAPSHFWFDDVVITQQ
jgi:hypothetical protein